MAVINLTSEEFANRIAVSYTHLTAPGCLLRKCRLFKCGASEGYLFVPSYLSLIHIFTMIGKGKSISHGVAALEYDRCV